MAAQRGRGTDAPPKSLSCEAKRVAEGLADRLLTLLRADGESVGSDELGFDADEVEHAAKLGFEMLERRRG